jgi:hypothetical protein
MGFLDDPDPCPHVKPPACCPVCAKLRDALARLEKIANTIRIAAETRDPEIRLQLLRSAYALAAGLREPKSSCLPAQGPPTP